MADRPYREVKDYKITVQVTYTVDIPVRGRDEEEALECFERAINKHDDYEIVNRSSKRMLEIVEVKENHGK